MTNTTFASHDVLTREIAGSEIIGQKVHTITLGILFVRLANL